MNNEIIKVEQLPIITERLHEIKAEVTAKVEAAKSLVCTEDTVKAIKKERAELTKDFKWYEERRKEVKNAITKPYNDFEAVYKECITDVFKQADADLKSKIDSVENELKEQKRKEVFYYFEELCEANGLDFLTFERANINVTLSESMKKLKEQAKAFVDRVCDDLALIDTQEHKTEILVEYKNSLNVSAAITTVVNRHKAIEEAKAREEERNAREKAAQKAAEKVETVAEMLTPPTAEPIAPPVEEEKIMKTTFTLEGTLSQLKEVKNFIISKGIKIL